MDDDLISLVDHICMRLIPTDISYWELVFFTICLLSCSVPLRAGPSLPLSLRKPKQRGNCPVYDEVGESWEKR